MKNTFKKTVIAAGVAAALGFSMQAGAIGTILFDRDGTGGATGSIRVDTFDWAPDNILATDMLSTTSLVSGGSVIVSGSPVFSSDFDVYMQGVLGGFQSFGFTNAGAASCTASGPGSNCYAMTGTQFTFELATSQRVSTSTTSGSTTTLQIDPLAGGPPNPGSPNTFTIYYNSTGIGTADVAAGTGYNTGIPILTGLVYDSAWDYSLNQNDADKDVEATSKLKKLDSAGSDLRPTIGTYSGNGSAQFDITVVSQNSDFFITDLLGTSVTVGMNLTSATSNPFQQAEPALLVMGNTPFYGTDTTTGVFKGGAAGASTGTRYMNDFDCGAVLVSGDPLLGTAVYLEGTNAQSCDHQLQNDGVSAFFNPESVPEPGSLALLGAGLLGFGWVGRRARRKLS